MKLIDTVNEMLISAITAAALKARKIWKPCSSFREKKPWNDSAYFNSKKRVEKMIEVVQKFRVRAGRDSQI